MTTDLGPKYEYSILLIVLQNFAFWNFPLSISKLHLGRSEVPYFTLFETYFGSSLLSLFSSHKRDQELQRLMTNNDLMKVVTVSKIGVEALCHTVS